VTRKTLHRLRLILSFRFDAKERMILEVSGSCMGQELDMALSALMTFILNKESELEPVEADCLYLLSKMVKKVQLGTSSVIYGLVFENDMARFLGFLRQHQIPAQWQRSGGSLAPIAFDAPLPVTISVSQKGRQLVLSMNEREFWLADPLAWQVFTTERAKMVVCWDVVSSKISPIFENLIIKFLDHEEVRFNEEETIRFIRETYPAIKNSCHWQIRADFQKILPVEITPHAVLSMTLEGNLLVPLLSYSYADLEIASDDPELELWDKRRGKRFKRILELEQIYQQDLITLFLENELPFLLESPGDQAKFLDQIVPVLRERGWEVRHQDLPDIRVIDSVVDLTFQVNHDNDWFHFDQNCQVMGESFSFSEMAAVLVTQHGYLKTKQGFVRVSDNSLGALKHLAALRAFSSKQGFKRADILPLIQEYQIEGGDETSAKWIKRFHELGGSQDAPPGDTFVGTLRAYQQHGVNWMNFLCEAGLGGILADDMGLGKTVQTIALCTRFQKPHKPILVVGPTTVIYNWKSELKQFWPTAKVLVHTGSERNQSKREFEKSDVIISTYGVLKNDIDLFSQCQFIAVFFDEAQALKNPKAQVSQAVKCIKADFRICMTGTPIENHLRDLWNLFDVAMPGYLGSQKEFDACVSSDSMDSLRQRVKPFVLRREKREVLTSLPPKTEIIMACPLTPEQTALYQSVLNAAKGKTGLSGFAKAQHLLTTLLKLRQICLHPGIITDLGRPDFPSAKFDLMTEKLSELTQEGHKAVVFSQFTKMLDVMEKWAKETGIHYERIDGSTSAKGRQEAVERFQKDERPSVFFISLKAGGVGINLTAAEYVFHLDPWWNPAVEAQATDRVHRIGQENPVMVYKLIAEGTIESKIQDMQNEKKALLAQIVDIDTVADNKIDVEEIGRLLFG